MTVYKRGKAWSVQVSWYTVEAGGKKKRHFKTKGGFKTKKEAQLWETQEKLAKSKGQISDKTPFLRTISGVGMRCTVNLVRQQIRGTFTSTLRAFVRG